MDACRSSQVSSFQFGGFQKPLISSQKNVVDAKTKRKKLAGRINPNP
jgi:hypothetical protein